MVNSWVLVWVRVGTIGLFMAHGGARAQHMYSHGDGGGMTRVGVPGAVGAVSSGRYIPYWETIGPDGLPIVLTPPILMIAPRAAFLPPPAIGPALPPPNVPGGRVNVPWPPRRPLAKDQPKPGDAARAKQLTTFGDRNFRAANFHRAAERYEQALRAENRSAAPHVGLAQIAIARGQYDEAAGRFRQALEAEPLWLINAPDVQALYGEPADFARTIAKLESHLQANPTDRDAWFVLGAQWYLSGRTQKAADIFLRLADRKPDPTLSAFIDAATPERK
jgi:hypothetical protein